MPMPASKPAPVSPPTSQEVRAVYRGELEDKGEEEEEEEGWMAFPRRVVLVVVVVVIVMAILFLYVFIKVC